MKTAVFASLCLLPALLCVQGTAQAARIHNQIDREITIKASMGALVVLKTRDYVELAPGGQSESLEWSEANAVFVYIGGVEGISGVNSNKVCALSFQSGSMIRGGNYLVVTPGRCEIFDSNKKSLLSQTFSSTNIGPYVAPVDPREAEYEKAREVLMATYFEKKADSALSGLNHATYENQTAAQCANACISVVPWCHSFDYTKATRRCDLSMSSWNSPAGIPARSSNAAYDHYVIKPAYVMTRSPPVAQ